MGSNGLCTSIWVGQHLHWLAKKKTLLMCSPFLHVFFHSIRSFAMLISPWGMELIRITGHIVWPLGSCQVIYFRMEEWDKLTNPCSKCFRSPTAPLPPKESSYTAKSIQLSKALSTIGWKSAWLFIFCFCKRTTFVIQFWMKCYLPFWDYTWLVGITILPWLLRRYCVPMEQPAELPNSEHLRVFQYLKSSRLKLRTIVLAPSQNCQYLRGVL